MFVIEILCFHLGIDAVTPTAISKMESIVTRYLKKWLHLPRSATRVILYYPGICCPSVSHITGEAKLSLLSCINASSDPMLQELGVHLHLGKVFLQFQEHDYSILSAARKQLSSLPTAKCIKNQLSSPLVRIIFKHYLFSPSLETQLNLRHPVETGTVYSGHLSFLLRAASDTLPAAMNLRRWNIQCSAKCILCDSSRPTTAHVLTPFRPDIVIHNTATSTLRLFELTCPLDSTHHLGLTSKAKLSTIKYYQN